MSIPLYIYALSLAIVLLVFRGRIRKSLIPRGIPGIPTLSSGVPIWGDIPLMGKVISDQDSFSYWFDWVARELGPICQVRAGFFLK